MNGHVCGIDCKLTWSEALRQTVHVMYPTLPTSAAGRYQWEQNQKILHMGKGARKAWRETGQGETRNNRIYAVRRADRLWGTEWKGGERRQAKFNRAANLPVGQAGLAPDERYGHDAWGDGFNDFEEFYD